jgi:hypothetical protein
MKTILISIMLLCGLMGKAEEPLDAKPSEAALKQMMVQEIETQLSYPDLKLPYMDALEAKIYFVLTDDQEVQVVHVSASNVELNEQLKTKFKLSEAPKVSNEQKIYSIRVHFN